MATDSFELCHSLKLASNTIRVGLFGEPFIDHSRNKDVLYPTVRLCIPLSVSLALAGFSFSRIQPCRRSCPFVIFTAAQAARICCSTALTSDRLNLGSPLRLKGSAIGSSPLPTLEALGSTADRRSIERFASKNGGGTLIPWL